MTNDHEDTIASRVRSQLDARGLSVRGAAKLAGLPESTIRNILDGITDSPRGVTMTKLAALFGVSEQWLMTGGGVAATHPAYVDEPNRSPARAVPNVRLVPDSALPPDFNLPKDLQLLGTAAGSEIGRGAFQLSSDVVEYVRRPPGLLGVRDAYALYVEGESMSPRFEPGDMIFVHPHRKALVGDYIVIQEPDHRTGETQAFVKRLVKVTPTVLRVKQFNPDATFDFAIRPGLVWHKVLTDGDLYSF